MIKPTKAVSTWQVKTFDAHVVNGLNEEYRLHLGVADVGGADGALIMEFTKLMNEFKRKGHGWSQLLPFDQGVPVVLEEAIREPETEFLYKEEVTGIEEREVPAKTYEVPAGYKKVKFNSNCVRLP